MFQIPHQYGMFTKRQHSSTKALIITGELVPAPPLSSKIQRYSSPFRMAFAYNLAKVTTLIQLRLLIISNIM